MEKLGPFTMRWLFSIGLLSLVLLNTGFCVWWGSFYDAMDYITGERCIQRMIPSDIEGLKYEFKEKVFGQPFLEGALIPLLRRHLGIGMPEDYIPKKALALSFHGSPGVGKTYVSYLIAKNIFKNAEKSMFYRHMSLGNSWLTDENELRKSVLETVRKCDRAVFVFDEIEKMTEGLFEVIKSFLDFHSFIEGVDFRKTIFIFISNVGMDRINNLALSRWKQGILSRKDYKLSDFEHVLQESVYNEVNGLKKSTIVKNFLIDLYLPFLPLENSHVKNCIRQEASAVKLHVSETDIEKILESIIFLPPEEKIYSTSGCKHIASMVKIHGHDEL